MDAVPSELGVTEGGPTLLLLRTESAAAMCDVSARTWRTWDAAGKVPMPVRIGRVPFWRVEELKAWIAAGCPDRVTWQIMQN